MSTLFLIRHGQASLGADDYDRLSPLGREQSARLGPYFVARETVPDRLVVGPRRRHAETRDEAVGAWPELPQDLLDLLDEHQCPEILEFHRERLDAAPGADLEADATKTFLRRFRHGSLLWARGELETPPGMEPWAQFRARIGQALDHLRHDIRRPDAKVALFTSGGVVAAAVGEVLGLDDEKTLQLSWGIQNASITTLSLSRAGYGLSRFNELPFRSKRLETFV